MLEELGNGRWKLSGVSYELWLTSGKLERHSELYATGIVHSFEVVCDLSSADVYVVINEGNRGYIALFENGEKKREWIITSDNFDFEGVDDTVMRSADSIRMFHDLICRGRQFGCYCGD